MSVMESMFKTLAKSIDIPAIIAHPKVQEFIDLIKAVKTEFEETRASQARMEMKIDLIATRLNVGASNIPPTLENERHEDA